MATKAKFLKQFSYAASANLVLNQEHRAKASEPSGEAESLWGKMDAVRMGDRYIKPKVADLEERVSKIKVKRKEHEEEEILDLERSRRRAADVMAATERLETLGYHPKTKETKAAYEVLYNAVIASWFCKIVARDGMPFSSIQYLSILCLSGGMTSFYLFCNAHHNCVHCIICVICRYC